MASAVGIMEDERISGKRTDGQHKRDVRKNGSPLITRAEFEKVLDERDQVIDQLRHELRSTCRELTEDVRRELQTQFTRIAQIQQEIDQLKKGQGT
jgi:hypothetical protein